MTLHLNENCTTAFYEIFYTLAKDKKLKIISDDYIYSLELEKFLISQPIIIDHLLLKHDILENDDYKALDLLIKRSKSLEIEAETIIFPYCNK